MSPVDRCGNRYRWAIRCACVPLPAPGGPSKITAQCSPVARLARFRSAEAAATQLSLLDKPFVVPHHQLSLDLLNGVHRHTNDDQEGSATKIKIYLQALQHEPPHVVVEPRSYKWQVLKMDTGHQPLREQTNCRQIDSADERQAAKDAVDMLRGIAPRANSRDETAVLPHVVG